MKIRKYHFEISSEVVQAFAPTFIRQLPGYAHQTITISITSIQLTYIFAAFVAAVSLNNRLDSLIFPAIFP